MVQVSYVNVATHVHIYIYPMIAAIHASRTALDALLTFGSMLRVNGDFLQCRSCQIRGSIECELCQTTMLLPQPFPLTTLIAICPRTRIVTDTPELLGLLSMDVCGPFGFRMRCLLDP